MFGVCLKMKKKSNKLRKLENSRFLIRNDGGQKKVFFICWKNRTVNRIPYAVKIHFGNKFSLVFLYLKILIYPILITYICFKIELGCTLQCKTYEDAMKVTLGLYNYFLRENKSWKILANQKNGGCIRNQYLIIF